jgi:hypothetical protein
MLFGILLLALLEVLEALDGKILQQGLGAIAWLICNLVQDGHKVLRISPYYFING